MNSNCCYPLGSVTLRIAARALVVAFTVWGVTPGWAQQDDIRPFLPVLASGGDTTIQLRWAPPAGEVVRGYRVYWAGADRPFLDERSLQNPTCTVIGLSNSTEYNLIITAVLTDDREWRGYRTVTATPERTVPMDPNSEPDIPTGVLRLKLSDRIAGLKHWEVFRYGDPDHRLVRRDGSALTAALDPGFYQVAIWTVGSASELVWPEVVGLAAGDERTITLASGIRLDAAEGGGPLFRWSVVTADGTKLVKCYEPEVRDSHYMLLPPGEYQVAIHPTSANWMSQWLTWPQRVVVEAGQYETLRLDSGIEIDVADETVGGWRIVRADRPEEVVQAYSDSAANLRSMLLPPGIYLLEFLPDEPSASWRRVEQQIVVEQDRITTVRIGSLHRP